MATTYPSWSTPQTIDEIRARSSFTTMHPIMQERLERLIKGSGGRVGLGQGYRSEEEQRQMFLSRYVVDPHGPTQYDGKRWRKKDPRLATAAPPGRSMHEIGLAADMAGDHAWVVANCSRFALRHFAFVNDEPWHVQPFELPTSRFMYEQAGSPWAPAKSTNAASGDLEVVPGMRGPVVGKLQDLLIKLRLIRDVITNHDQFYGPATVEVIRRFQATAGLRVDGRVGPMTWAALRAAR